MKKKFDRSRWLSFFLAVLLAAEMFTAGAHIRAASVAEEDLFTYFISGNEVTITGTTPLAGKDLVIPDTLEGKPVTAIRGRRLFRPGEGDTGGPGPCLSGLTSVEIPASVTSIGSGAFACPELTSITVNEENPVYHSAGNCLIQTKRKELIAGCKTSTIPSDGSVTEIGDSAFLNCEGLTSVEIPSGVTAIGDGAFSYCTGLTSIELPSSVTLIGHSAFRYCTGLTTIEIPSGVTVIDSGAFMHCTELTSIELPSNLTAIGYSAFYDCRSLISIELPEGVELIDTEAFRNCKSLSSICIPSTVRELNSSFRGCSSLTSIVVAPENQKYHSDGNCLIETKVKKLIMGCGTSVIPLDGSVTSINDYAFEACSGLTSIKIPSCIASIGRGAFYRCGGLISIVVEEGNPIYHSDGNCLIETESKTLLAGSNSSVIPADGSVTSIDDYAFMACSGLTSIKIPSCVTSIGYSAFSGCTGLTSIEIPDGVNKIAAYTFSGCSALETVKIPSSVTSIKAVAFQGCSKLSAVTIPEGVLEIDSIAFDGCNLTSIKIPASVTSIDEMSFINCSDLNSIVVDEKNPIYHSEGNCLIETMTKTLVVGCRSSVIPADGSVVAIGKGAFYGCAGLTSIEIPASVTTISKYAFLRCPNLTIRGYSGTRAESFAGKNGIPFYEIVFGDLDKKDGVGSADAVYLLMHVFYPEDYPVMQLCDFNGDSTVDSADAVYLLMHVFYPEDYPLPQ